MAGWQAISTYTFLAFPGPAVKNFGCSLSTGAVTLLSGETVSNVGIIDGAVNQLSQLMNDPGMGLVPWMQ